MKYTYLVLGQWRYSGSRRGGGRNGGRGVIVLGGGGVAIASVGAAVVVELVVVEPHLLVLVHLSGVPLEAARAEDGAHALELPSARAALRVAEAVLVLVVPQLQRFERLDVGDLVEDLAIVLNDM